MHIEPGVVDGAKILLGHATAVASFGLAAKLCARNVQTDGRAGGLAARGGVTTALVVMFFQVLPHQAVGVSEVHLILGSTLFLLFGAGAASIGLALGLLLQALFFAPLDLPQYGMNVTTLLAPLWLLSLVARRTIAPSTAYVDLSYGQVLKLSVTYQAGVVGWVAFWVTYGRGFGVETLASVGVFGVAYLSVIVVEPLVDLAVLAGAKALHRRTSGPLFNARLWRPAH